MAGIPLAGRYADPYGFAQNPYSDPHALAGYLTRYTTTQEQLPLAKEAISLGYYNSGFLSGLGGVLRSVGPYIAAAGTIAAEVLPAIYHTGGAQQAPAAGPTAAPAMAKTNGGMTSTAIVKKIESIADPAFLGGPGSKTKKVTHKIHADGTITKHHHRRMNPCNIKALRRSMRRAYAFERIAKRVLHMTSPKHHVAGFRKPKRRS